MEQFTQKTLPDYLDEPFLIKSSIENKYRRTIGVPKSTIPRLITLLAQEIYINDSPLPEDIALQSWGMAAYKETPSGLFESALISRMGDSKYGLLLDFYYSRDRDFTISFLARKWDKVLYQETEEKIVEELGLAIKTNAGTDAGSALDVLKSMELIAYQPFHNKGRNVTDKRHFNSLNALPRCFTLVSITER